MTVTTTLILLPSFTTPTNTIGVFSFSLTDEEIDSEANEPVRECTAHRW